MKYKKMKNFITAILTILLLVSFVLRPAFAQEVNTTTVNAPITDQEVNARPAIQEVNSEITNPVVNKPISNKEIQTPTVKTPKIPGTPELFNTEQTDGAVVTEYDVFRSGGLGKGVDPKVQSAITNLEVKALEIFSPIFSEIENLIVNPAIVDDKVVYKLEKKNINKPIFRENEVLQSIFDLRVDQPVEFKLVDNKIIVNDEQVIDYKEIVREKEVMPPVELEINSAITDGKVHDLKVIPSPESAEFKFIYREKEVMMPIYSDFKVENKKLYLIHNKEVHDLRVSPPEIYSAVYDLRVKEPKIVIKELSLKIENEKPIYDLRVEEPFKLLWIIPMKIKARYFIDPTDGSITNKERPWYHWLGDPNPLNQYGQLI